MAKDAFLLPEYWHSNGTLYLSAKEHKDTALSLMRSQSSFVIVDAVRSLRLLS